MAIHVALHHITRYSFDRPVSLNPHIVRLRPAPHCRTRVLGYNLKVTPEDHFINWQQDPQSNYLARLSFPQKTRELTIEVDLVAEMSVFNPFDFFLEPSAERYPFKYDSILDHELEPFRKKGPLTPNFQTYLESIRKDLIKNPAGDSGSLMVHSNESEDSDSTEDDRCTTIDLLVEINQRLWKDIQYLIRMEPGVQSPEETLTNGSGSCRDSAWLLCQLLRHLGLAARFVSGYLLQLAPDVKSLDGPSGPEKDFTDLHAWTEVYLPGAGWIGLDATSGLLAGEGHLPLAATPDPSSAAPVTGSLEPCETKFSFDMSISRIFESPRVTKPYSEEQWERIKSLGTAIDRDLKTGDVRLTMGGEPTFVSIDDMDGPEWNTEATGPQKRKLADQLVSKLKTRYAPGGFLHYGQGKWYPGEQLPRWAFACYWRKDGVPIWNNPDLFATESGSYQANTDDAAIFIRELATRLDLDEQWIIPAYEDPYYYIWKERRLPVNVDPFKSKLSDPEERARLAEVFERGLDEVSGYVLPLQRNPEVDEDWRSGPWFKRTERMYLLPGDSPIGFRLPLDSLPWVSKEDYPYTNPQDPTEPRDLLPPARKDIRQRYRKISRSPRGVARRSRFGPRAQKLAEPEFLKEPSKGESAVSIVRTALTVQARKGRIHIFMPPVHCLEDYLDLLSAIEETATALKQPIQFEGYEPPFDPRLEVIKVTPDPGVIEVNAQPVRTWDELVENTTFLYEAARESRLGAEKFMVDGRHTGTGGGNHIVVGGATPLDSPFLRRPDLLRSMITYWQNHPALSYLFSGLFIGPTSQSPRVDEARHDSLFELEVAFKQIDNTRRSDIPPWLTDRLFRNLLTDLTGNTHRAEFCIDKLYSPDSSTGRLGLVELRGFEMPPHERMSLTQQLLLRALISRFWREPYKEKLIRWGTRLADRWMLPHYIWADICGVVSDLKEHGYAFEDEWFAPHFEFRFPIAGDFTCKEIELELRQALEPWHVLGEEGSSGGTVRFVDSSVERLQIKVKGLTESRYQITCNGHSVPLHKTMVHGEFVAGIRFRAWQPPSCLHPTIAPHNPLVFELIDTWNKRSLGGCTYHVMHPGGRNYNRVPVNAFEAESRRLARFFRHGHTGGLIETTPPWINPEFPHTLDLRTV